MRTNASCIALPLVMVGCTVTAWSVDIRRTPFTKEEAAQVGNSKYASKVVKGDHLIFPSGIYGTKPNPVDQVEEVVEKAHALLKAQGLGMGAMLQHTMFVKNGAVSTMAVLERFHKTAARLDPSLNTAPSVGTIIRLPHMPGNSVVMLDIVAGDKLPKGPKTDPDGYTRVPLAGFKEIAETVTGKHIVFTSGMEAQEPKGLAKTLDGQVEAVVGKLDAAFKRAGISLSQMLQHNLYYRADVDPAALIKKFHEEMAKRDPLYKQHPGVGAMMAVNGMVGDSYMLEVDAIGTTMPAKDIKGVPFTEVQMDVHKTAQAGNFIPVVDVLGVDYPAGMKTVQGNEAQIQTAVKNLKAFLAQGGLSLKDMVKVRLMVTKEAGEAEKIRSTFYEALYKLEPATKQNPPAETLMYVERLGRDRVIQIVPIAMK